MEDQDTESLKFGKKNHSGWHMGGEVLFGIFFATSLVRLFYPLSNHHISRKGKT